MLRANLFGAIRVANAPGPVYDRAEAMRYLAEMPWAPDAVLGNPEVTWRDLDDGRSRRRLTRGRAGWPSRFTLDAAGDIAEMTALRPDAGPDGAEIAREWRGRYTDYAGSGGGASRSGEVGYVDDGCLLGLLARADHLAGASAIGPTGLRLSCRSSTR
jgi:hypothetical protein